MPKGIEASFYKPQDLVPFSIKKAFNGQDIGQLNAFFMAGCIFENVEHQFSFRTYCKEKEKNGAFYRFSMKKNTCFSLLILVYSKIEVGKSG